MLTAADEANSLLTINALSLWQPWATCIAPDWKTRETRSWPAPIKIKCARDVHLLRRSLTSPSGQVLVREVISNRRTEFHFCVLWCALIRTG